MNTQNKLDLAWAAGLFEGEGCICFSNKTILLSVDMTDEDTVHKFFKIIGYGYLNGPYKAKKISYKPHWQWRVQGNQYPQTIIAAFWPWLGSRRKQQFKDSVAKWKLVPPRSRVKCKQGHLLTVINTKGTRGCMLCVNERRRNNYRINNPLPT